MSHAVRYEYPRAARKHSHKVETSELNIVTLRAMHSPVPALGLRFAVLLLCWIHVQASAQSTAIWDNSSGNWSDGARWSSNPNFPDNGNPGGPYTAVVGGGFVTLDANFTINALTFTGGQILGSGGNSLTLAAGASSWSAGFFSGELSVLAPATLNVSGDNTDTLSGRRLRNNGLVVLSASSNNFRLGSGAMIENRTGGLFDLQNNGTFLDVGGGFGSFVNNAGATLRKSVGTGTSVFNLPLTNNGAVEVQTGTLALSGGGASAGSFNVTTGALLNITNNYDLTNGASFTGPGFSRLVSGTLSSAGTVTANRFEMAGGTLAVASGSTFTVGNGGVLTFSNGTIAGAGSTNVASGGTLTFNGDNTDTINGTTLNNAGLAVVPAGSNNLRLGGGAQIQNNSGGVFDLQNDGTFLDVGGGFGTFINNAGATLRKSVGTGTSAFNVPLTNKLNASVDVQTGTLSLTGGGSSAGNFNVAAPAVLLFNSALTLNAGATLTGAGVFRLPSNTLTINGPVSSQNFDLAGGSLSVALNATFTIGNGGTLTFNNGTMTGAGSTNVASGGALNINGDNTDTLNGTTLNNAGIITLTSGSNNFRLGSGAVINNNLGGIFDLKNNGVFSDVGGGFGTFVNNNGGILRKSAGSAVSTFNLPLTNNGLVQVQIGEFRLAGGGSGSGSFDVTPGALLNIVSAYSAVSGVTFGGNGTTRLSSGGTLTANGAVTAHSFEVAGGTLTAAASSTFTIGNGDVLNFNNGTINGAGSTNVAAGGLLNMNGDNTDTLDGTTLNNAGTIILASSSNNFRLGSGANIQNNSGGLFQLQNNGTFIDIGGGFGSFTNNAGATLRKSVGTGTSTFNAPLINNLNGVVDVQTGTLAIAGGGTSTGNFNVASGAQLNFTNNYTLNAATTFTGDGFTVLSAGTLTVGGDISAHRFQINGGTLFLTPPALFNINSGDTLNFGNGTISGPGLTRVAANGALNISGDNTDTFSGTTLANFGTVTLSTGSNNLRLGSGASLQNKSGGLFDLQNDGTFLDIGGGFGSFANELGAILRKSAGGGTSTFNIPMNNVGTVEVQSGTLNLTNTVTQLPATTLTGGTWKVFAGATLNIASGGANITANQGDVTLSGAGSSFTKIDTLANNQGAFSILAGRNFTTLGDLDNSGTITAGDGSTFTVPSGTFTNSGTLDIRTNGTFVSQTPTFTNFAGSTLTGGSYLIGGTFKFQGANIVTNAATITLDGAASQIVDQTNADALASFANNTFAGNFTVKNGRNFSRSIAFTNAGNVTAGANSTFTLAAGGLATGTFTVNSTGAVNFTGGTFLLDGGSAITGAGVATLSAGIVNAGDAASDSITVQNFAVSGGTLGGNGTLTASESFNWTGGTMTDGGTTAIASSGSLAIGTGNLHVLAGRTINNGGTLTWTGTGGIRATAGTNAITNLSGGIFNAQNDSFTEQTSGGTLAINNQAGATLTKSGAGTTTGFSFDTTFNNAGTVNVQSGTLAIQGGASSGSFAIAAGGVLGVSGNAPQTLSPTSSVTGAGIVNVIGGTIDIAGAYTMSGDTNVSGGTVNFNTANASAGGGTLSGGTIGGNGTLNINGAYTWTGGAMSGGGTTAIASSSSLAIDTGNLHVLAGRTINNGGTLTWTGIGGIRATAGTNAITNLSGGIFNAQNDSFTEVTSGGTLAINNQAGATLNKSGPGTTTGFSFDTTFNNAGTVNVQSGTLAIQGGTSSGSFAIGSGGVLSLSGSATQSLSPSSSVTGAGIVNFTGGTTDIAGAYTVSGDTNVSGGTVNFNAANASLGGGSFSGGTLGGNGTLTINGAYSWTGGTMGGGGTTAIASSASLAIGTGNLHLLVGRTINNSGTLTWTGTGGIRAAGGTNAITNLSGGVFNAQNDSFTEQAFGGTLAINNQAGATLTKSGAGTTTGFSFGTTFNNAGTVNVQSGTLGLGTYTQTGGVLKLDGGAVTTTDALNIIAGSLQGTGTITGKVTNGGRISPGFSAGELDIAGDLTLGSTSNLAFEIGGTVQSTQYDFLSEAGTSALSPNGTLTLSLINNFNPTGFSFTIVTSNANLGSGQFNNVAPGARLNTNDGFGSFRVDYGPSSNSIVLSNFQGVPEPDAFLLLLLGGIPLAGRVVGRRE